MDTLILSGGVGTGGPLESLPPHSVDKTIAVKINTDDNAPLTKRFNVTAIPCVVFVDGDGTEVGRIIGFQPADRFLEDAGKFVK